MLARAIGRRKNIRAWRASAIGKEPPNSAFSSAQRRPQGLTVARSSGFPVLDEQALTMVKGTVPLPEMPAALRGREFAITVPVVFRLE